MAEQAKQTHDVVVHKAIVALKTGESLSQFTRSVSDAGRDFIRKQLNLSAESKADVYAVEVFASSAVFDVFMYGPDVDVKKRQRYFAASYTRKTDAFEFDNMTEVVRKTTFEKKPQGIPVTKAAESVEELDGASGWVDVAKASAALWDGVI